MKKVEALAKKYNKFEVAQRIQEGVDSKFSKCVIYAGARTLNICINFSSSDSNLKYRIVSPWHCGCRSLHSVTHLGIVVVAPIAEHAQRQRPALAQLAHRQLALVAAIETDDPGLASWLQQVDILEGPCVLIPPD